MSLRFFYSLPMLIVALSVQPLADAGTLGITTQRVASGLASPVFACAAPGDSTRLFIVEQGSAGNGRIRILNLTNGTLQASASAFLTITGISAGGEEGLLGLAFHPDYATNRFFYIYYNTGSGNLAIARYTTLSNDADHADTPSAFPILTVPHPGQGNHNGGWIGFNPVATGAARGYLYIATGDGGSGNDPPNNAQNLNVLLGKMLRLDVNGDDFPADAARNYAIPPTNPFAGATAGADEIWAYGLRNPWRCSFDRQTGDLWIGDVGQGQREEIDFQPANSTGGQNYGWRVREGLIKTPSINDTDIPPANRTDPVHDYNAGRAVIGGYRYRGTALTGVQGVYFFADNTNSNIWSATFNGVTFTATSRQTEVAPAGLNISGPSGFGEDSQGELYICDHPGGELFKFVPALSITTPAALPATTEDVPYSLTLAAASGTPPYTWSVETGSTLPAGMTLSAAGLLSGTPATPNAYTFTVRLTDNATTVTTRAFTLTVNVAPSISTAAALPDGNVAVDYSRALAAGGGTGTLSWTVAAGSTLPSGLSLSSAGGLSGTPLATGNFSFSLRVTDTVNATATRAFTLRINNALAIATPSPLPTTTAGIAYAQTLVAAGGTPGYSWAVTTGSALPAGLSLAPNGNLSGTPTASGTFTFSVTVSDSISATASKTLELTINAALSVSSASPLPAANIDAPYSQSLATAGGTAAITWTISAGALPPAITLSSAGVLSGTPTSAGAFSFTAQAADSVGATASKAFDLAVSNAPAFVSTPVTKGIAGTSYTYDANATGRPAPTFSLVTALAGMSIDAATGVISWTPSAPGSFAVTVQAANGIEPHATQNFTLVVVPPYGLNSRPLALPYLNMPSTPSGTIPALLSQTGAFGTTQTLAAGSSLIPYGVNAPLWADGAHKDRWISIPNDGAPYGVSETIGFATSGEWTFPAGTVFVKHFELATDERAPATRRRLETRLLMVQANSTVYGVTYRWNAAGTDATLLTDGINEDITITAADGSTRTQMWSYPSRTDCLACHNANSGGVLGVKTRQQNGEFSYPGGVTDNQLRTWNFIRLFDAELDESTVASMARLVPLTAATEPLENRVRSYLDSNCAQCHRPGGSPAQFDARYDTPLADQKIVDGPVNDPLGIGDARVIAPGFIPRSILHVRVSATDIKRMPPLARNIPDMAFITTLEKWIREQAPRPVVTSGLTLNTARPLTGGEIVFSIGATGAASWLWNFGDNTTSTSANSASHMYGAPGHYTLTLTLTSDAGGVTTVTQSVTVIAPFPADTDGDGVADETEIASGSDPFNAQSVTRTAFSVSRLSATVNFKTPGNDHLSVSGKLPEIPALFEAAGQRVSLDVGGVREAFVLDKRGRGRSKNSTITFVLRPSKRNRLTGKSEFQGGPLAFTAQLRKGDFAAAWADEGVDKTVDAKKAKLTFTVDIGVNNTAYSAPVETLYSARQNVSGHVRK